MDDHVVVWASDDGGVGAGVDGGVLLDGFVGDVDIVVYADDIQGSDALEGRRHGEGERVCV